MNAFKAVLLHVAAPEEVNMDYELFLIAVELLVADGFAFVVVPRLGKKKSW